MDKLRNIIIKILKENLNPPSNCSCGCNSCPNPQVTIKLLNESLINSKVLSEGIKYHIDTKTPLTENVYRAGSVKYFNLWNEARILYSRNLLEVNENDLEILTETDLGNFGLLEDGTKVPLDFPIEINENSFEETINFDIHIINGRKVVLATMNHKKVGALRLKPFLNSYQVDDVMVRKEYRKQGIGTEMYRLANDEVGPLYSDKSQTNDAKYVWKKLLKNGEAYYNPDLNRYVMNKTKSINESKNKNKPIGKPRRGGPKKFYVYVRDPKTKKVKKVTFGDSGGLKTKINDPKARKAFAARHKCGQGEEKTSPKWWSCRLPRFSKLLGLKSNFTGFW
jgi:hypothetical protein